ncbi:MAG: signal peptidase I [Candidatus Eisenbacteria sp.]|nr:signal peptidase I [Candidatus Eisenbacteria bacterium]
MASAATKKGQAPKGKKSLVREYAEVIVVSLVLAFFVRAMVVQAFRIPTGSMEETLLIGDYLLVNKFLYGARIPFLSARLPAIRSPHRGDIIVFRSPTQNKDFIKRCVATGGEIIELRDNVVYIDGEPLEEFYTHFVGRPHKGNFGPVKVPKGYVFVLGDNRNNSQDSRYWGMLDIERIKGKAMVLYFSWNAKKHWPRWARIGRILH